MGVNGVLYIKCQSLVILRLWLQRHSMAPYLNFIYPSYKQYFVHRKKCYVTYLGSQKLMFTWFICEFNSSLPYSKWFPINILPIILLHVLLLSFFNLSLCLILLFVSEYVQSNISTTLSRRHISYVNIQKLACDITLR